VSAEGRCEPLGERTSLLTRLLGADAGQLAAHHDAVLRAHLLRAQRPQRPDGAAHWQHQRSPRRTPLSFPAALQTAALFSFSVAERTAARHFVALDQMQIFLIFFYFFGYVLQRSTSHAWHMNTLIFCAAQKPLLLHDYSNRDMVNGEPLGSGGIACAAHTTMCAGRASAALATCGHACAGCGGLLRVAPDSA